MRILILVAFLMVSLVGTAQTDKQVTKANYALANRFSPRKLDKMVFSLQVDPHWLKKSDRFWYVYETTEGKKWYLVDALKGEKRLLFDNAKMAAEITKVVKDPFDAQHLGLDSMRFTDDESSIQFEVKSSLDDETKKDAKNKNAAKEKKVFYFEYNLATQKLTELVGFKKPKRKPMWANISPDTNKIVFGRNYNLFMMDRVNYEKALLNEEDSTIVETQLTFDGADNFSYHTQGTNNGSVENNEEKIKNKNKRKPVNILWSPNSAFFTMVRTDQRSVKDLWVINHVAQPRPTIETYKYWMPGEKEAPIEHLLVFTVADKKMKTLPAYLFKDQTISVWPAPGKVASRDDLLRFSQWLGSNDGFYFARTSRDLKKVDICYADVKLGTVKPVIEERFNTYIELRRLVLVNDGKELIHWSERDGWGHFYLYGSDGSLKNQITTGAFHCEDVIGVDEKKRVLYFEANGREQGEDPYYVHSYKVNLDGSGLQLLNPGNFDHNSSFNDAKTFWVNNFSRVNTVPQSVLMNSDGKKLADLETADLSALFAAGYQFPQPFKVKADDGITDLYGVMYKPFDFDSTKKYPIIEYVYPGPQTEQVNKAFSRSMDRVDRLAQIGTIVISIGNRGGHPSRSKWYHNYGYGNLRNYGLADKKAAIEQLADKYSFIDANRVGIYGHSGGGFMSTAAMLVYPDFFKVAVSSSGNHDNAIYNRWWSEKHHGVKEIITEKGDTTFSYSIDKNQDIAKNLKGHLLLTTGDIDNNVHPAGTYKVAEALIKANKRFDLLLLPGQRHGYSNMSEYFFWSMADYFSRHLIGDKTERTVDIEEMNK